MLESGKAIGVFLRRTPKSIRLLLTILVILTCVLGSIVIFARIWEGNADTGTSQVLTEVEYLNTTRIYHTKWTIICEYYFPFTTVSREPNITKWLLSYVLVDNVRNYRYTSREFVNNSLESLRKENITIGSVESEWTYGEKDVRHPEKEINAAHFPDYVIYPMAKSTITIDWSYEISQSDDMPPYVRYELSYIDIRAERGYDWIALEVDRLLRPIVGIFPDDVRSLATQVVYYSFIVLFGFVFCSFLFRKKSDLKQAYKYLIKGKIDKTEDLSKNLKILTYRPKLLGGFTRIVCGLSIILFRNSINSQIKNLKNKNALEGSEDIDKQLSHYADDSDNKLSDLIPEQKTVLLALGFLTSVGISFSWNIGAVAPFLYSLGLFYVLLNLGSSFYLLRASKKDAIWIVIVLIGVILVSLSPQILQLLRG
jgi:hypothetical protein